MPTTITKNLFSQPTLQSQQHYLCKTIFTLEFPIKNNPRIFTIQLSLSTHKKKQTVSTLSFALIYLLMLFFKYMLLFFIYILEFVWLLFFLLHLILSISFVNKCLCTPPLALNWRKYLYLYKIKKLKDILKN